MFEHWTPNASGLLVALAIGFIVGAEREKHDAMDGGGTVSGLRTFSLVALASAAASLIAPPFGSLMALLFAGGLAIVSAARETRGEGGHHGMTTEVALFAVSVCGILAMTEPRAALALGVVLATLLAFRERLHAAVRKALRWTELLDMLTFAIAAAVIWPMLPERPIDPWGVIDPSRVWRLVVLVMGIQGLGHIARRAAGGRLGSAAAGFAGGFVSSTATIAAASRTAVPSAAVSALASSIATYVELCLLVGLASPELLGRMLPALATGALCMAVVTWAVARSVPTSEEPPPPDARAFSVRGALVFAAALTGVTAAVAAIRHTLGEGSAIATAALAGFADAHAVSASVASIHAADGLSLHLAGIAVLLAASTNTVTKLGVIFSSDDRDFKRRVVPGHVGALIAAWVVWGLGVVA